LHYTTQRKHARLFLEKGAAFLPSFPQPSGEYTFEFGLAECAFVTGRMGWVYKQAYLDVCPRSQPPNEFEKWAAKFAS
jgi:hypothetical protein